MRHNKSILFYSILTAISALLIYKILVEPRLQILRATREMYISKSELFDARNTISENIKNLKERNSEMQVKLVDMERKFVKNSEIHGYLNKLDFLADECGCTVKMLDPQETARAINQDVEKIFIKITISGDYPSIYRFLDLLMSGERLVSVEALSIDRNEMNDRMINGTFLVGLMVIDNA